jgi:hypothetical protein
VKLYTGRSDKKTSDGKISVPASFAAQKDAVNLSPMCSELSRQLQAHKSKNPSAMAGVFSVSDGGPGRNQPGLEDV